jgi:hypothetical protein
MKIVAWVLIGQAARNAKKRNPAVDVSGVDSLAKALCLDEGHPIPRG